MVEQKKFSKTISSSVQKEYSLVISLKKKIFLNFKKKKYKNYWF